MTPQERQLIETLFQRLEQGAAHAGARDAEAESLVQQRVQRLPGAPYYMAQALIVQQRALDQAEARIAALEERAGAGQSFLGGQPVYGTAAYGAPAYAGAAQRGGAGSFLAGAAQMALGIGGGILVANAAMSLAEGVFGDHGGQADAGEPTGQETAGDEGPGAGQGSFLDQESGFLDEGGGFLDDLDISDSW